MVLMKCHSEGYSMSSSTSTQIVFGGKKLRVLTKEKGKKTVRADPETGEEKDIFVYTYQHGDGICYLYSNETEDLTLEEEVEFQLTGLEIEGKPDESTIEFTVLPKQEKFIKLKSISQPWKIAMGVSYGIY